MKAIELRYEPASFRIGSRRTLSPIPLMLGSAVGAEVIGFAPNFPGKKGGGETEGDKE